jgi:hypothetical protein
MARQALSHVFDETGSFKTDREDHAYRGIDDGWIRWVQMGGVGLRVIYIRKQDTVYLYRVVGKSDEGGLSAPKDLLAKSIIESLPDEIIRGIGESAALIAERLLKNSSPTYLRDAFRKMYQVPQSEIILISPNISQPLFRFNGEIGRFLDRAIEEGARAALVTLPVPEAELPFYEDLARRNVEVYFVQNLRSRLFLFRVNEYRPRGVQEVVQPTALLGSAELTHHSLNMGEVGTHEELCYRFPGTHFSAFYEYAEALLRGGLDLQGHKMKMKGL